MVVVTLVATTWKAICGASAPMTHGDAVSESWTATLFGLAIALFGPLCVAIASERPAQAPNRLGRLLLAQAGLVAIVAAVLAVVFFWERNPASSIGLKSLTLQSLAWGFALAVFFT